MENQVTATLLTSDVRGYAGHDDDSGEVSVPRQIEALRMLKGGNTLAPAAIDKILGDNPARLYGL